MGLGYLSDAAVFCGFKEVTIGPVFIVSVFLNNLLKWSSLRLYQEGYHSQKSPCIGNTIFTHGPFFWSVLSERRIVST